MNDEEKITYLANLLVVARADQRISPDEMQVVIDAQKRIGATKTLLSKAQNVAEGPQYIPTPVGQFSAKIANLEDMLLVSLVEGTLDQTEKPIVLEFARKVGITNDQLQIVFAQCKAAITLSSGNRACSNCTAVVVGSAKFCPFCGNSLEQANQQNSLQVSYNVPVEGVAIEFSESTASGFADAVRRAQTAPVNATCVKGKKKWYLAAWPKDQIGIAAKLVDDLKGMRNRKVWVDGQESRWDDVFGFTWCHEQRNAAYRPIEYCFGVDEKRFNIWGCKQTRMDWVRWSNWFSYGQFKKAGGLKNQTVFTFDKNRIRHELETNLFSYRFCPHLNFRLIEAVLDAIPNEVEIKPNGPWAYKEEYEQFPGSIQITEKVVEGGGYSYTKEYYSSGVVPRSPEIGLEILGKAVRACGISESELKNVLAYRGE